MDKPGKTSSRRRKVLRIVRRSLAVFGVLLAAALITAMILVPDYVKETLEKEGSRLSGRSLKIATLDVNWGRGVLTVDDLSLADKEGERNLLTFQRLRLDLNMWSLFKKQIEVEGFELSRPQLFVERIESDNFNISDLILKLLGSPAAQAGDQAAGQVPPEESDGEPGKKANLMVKGRPFHLKDIRLKNFSFLFIDSSAAGDDERELKFTIRDFVFSLDRLSVDSFFAAQADTSVFTVSGSFLGSQLLVDGRLKMGNRRLELEQQVSLDGLDIGQSRPYFPLFAWFYPEQGQAQLKVVHRLTLEQKKDDLTVTAHSLTSDIKLARLRMGRLNSSDRLSAASLAVSGFELDLVNNELKADRVVVNRPAFNLVQVKNGHWNIERFFKLKASQKKKDKHQQKNDKLKKKGGAEEPSFRLELKAVRILQARLTVLPQNSTRYLINTRRVVYHNLRWPAAAAGMLAFKAALRPDLPAESEAEGNDAAGDDNAESAGGAQVEFKGRFNYLNQYLQGSLSVDKLNLAHYTRYLDFEYYPDRGRLSVQGEVLNSAKKKAFKGSATAFSASVRHRPSSEKVLELASLSVSAALAWLPKERQLTLTSSGTIEKHEPFSISYSGYPGRDDAPVEAAVELKNQDIGRYNWFIRKNSAYRIKTGALFVKSSLKMAGDKGGLDIDGRLHRIEAEEIGGHENRLPLSLNLAMKLLKDSAGNIPFKVAVPFKQGRADLENLQQLISSFIMKFLGNAVTAPFEAVAKLYMQSGRVEKIDFFPAEFELNEGKKMKPAALGVLKNLGAFMKRYPAIAVRLTARADAHKEYGYHTETVQEIVSYPIKKLVPVDEYDSPGSSGPSDGSAPADGSGLSQPVPDDTTLPGSNNTPDGQGAGSGEDSLFPGASGSPGAGNETLPPPGYKVVWEQAEKVVEKEKQVANDIPDVSYLKALLDERNRTVRDYLVDIYGVDAEKLGVDRLNPADTDSMTAARVGFSIWD